MSEHFIAKIADLLDGKADIRSISDEDISELLSSHPYSPYSHLLHYLKAKSANREDTNQLLQKLALYSPDRAWLQEVLSTGFQNIEVPDAAPEPAVPAEGKDPNLDNFIFEFDFNGEPSLNKAAETPSVKKDTKGDHTLEESASPDVEEEYSPMKGSYIEWLKSMRPVEDENATADLSKDTSSEQKTQQKEEIVVEQNTRKEDDLFGGIITETLAQLLANQGQIEKAISMYERLSLIFPDKSAFFAAKIKQLKSNIT